MKNNSYLPKIFAKRCLLCMCLLVGLSGCSISRVDSSAIERVSTGRQNVNSFPGGYQRYSWGTAQSFDAFLNIEHAQWDTNMNRNERNWMNQRPTKYGVAPSIIGLQYYYPLHVRWKLKDGREFINENIDIASIMDNYFKSNKILLGWQRENRPRSQLGDGGSILGHEIKDDKIIIKWFIEINRTPVSERFTSTGAATKWNMIKEEYHVITIDGKPTSGINFDKRLEILIK